MGCRPPRTLFSPEASQLGLVLTGQFASKGQDKTLRGLYFLTCITEVVTYQQLRASAGCRHAEASEGEAMSCQASGQQLSVGSNCISARGLVLGSCGKHRMVLLSGPQGQGGPGVGAQSPHLVQASDGRG